MILIVKSIIEAEILETERTVYLKFFDNTLTVYLRFHDAILSHSSIILV